MNEKHLAIHMMVEANDVTFEVDIGPRDDTAHLNPAFAKMIPPKSSMSYEGDLKVFHEVRQCEEDEYASWDLDYFFRVQSLEEPDYRRDGNVIRQSLRYVIYERRHQFVTVDQLGYLYDTQNKHLITTDARAYLDSCLNGELEAVFPKNANWDEEKFKCESDWRMQSALNDHFQAEAKSRDISLRVYLEEQADL